MNLSFATRSHSFTLEEYCADHVNLVEIVTTLSEMWRYNGHPAIKWSVGQHLCALDEYAVRVNMAPDAHLALVLHDAHEYLSGDIIRPVKQHFQAQLDALTDRLDSVIFPCFGLVMTPGLQAIVDDLDHRIADAEMYVFGVKSRAKDAPVPADIFLQCIGHFISYSPVDTAIYLNDAIIMAAERNRA